MMTDVFLGVLFALFVLVLANTYSVRDDTDGKPIIEAQNDD